MVSLTHLWLWLKGKCTKLKHRLEGVYQSVLQVPELHFPCGFEISNYYLLLLLCGGLKDTFGSHNHTVVLCPKCVSLWYRECRIDKEIKDMQTCRESMFLFMNSSSLTLTLVTYCKDHSSVLSYMTAG